MQTSLMFLDLKPLGVTPNSQKIAIKMPQAPEGLGDAEYSGFADIINALMAMKPDQLQDSLGQMDWIEVEGEHSGYAPLLDLSANKDNGANMAGFLVKEIVRNTNTSTSSMGINPGQVEHLDTDNVTYIRPGHGLAADHGAAQNHRQFTNEDLAQSLPKATTEDFSQSATPKAVDQQQNADLKISKQQVPVPPGEDFHPTALDKEAAVKSNVNFLSRADGSSPKEMVSHAFQPEEHLKSATKPNEQGAPRVLAAQNNVKADFSAQQAMDQQFGDTNNSETDPGLKQGIRAQGRSEEARPAFKFAEWDGLTDGSDDGVDPASTIKQEHREGISQVVSRSKVMTAKTVEHLSGQSEPAPQTNETQTNVIRQIVQRMHLHHQGSQSTMTLKLKPEFLGNVHMQITTDNQQVVVRMATESAAVKEMVEQGLGFLKTEMQGHGLEIDKFDVFVANDSDSSHPGQDLAGFRQALKQRQQNAMKKGQLKDGDEPKEISEKEETKRQTIGDPNEVDYFA